MPTNRPFLASFLAAFRAHSVIQPAPSTNPSVPSPAAPPQPTHIRSSTSHTVPAPAARSISNKAGATGATTAAVQAAGHINRPRPHSPSPMSRSPASSPTSPSALGDRRRGSDSSSEGGFRDALGNEKWYIGGRTARGDERFYRLSMVRRERSGDRLSLDRLSL
ncbi:hypothetical protein MMC20_001787 [Loxospora ochrophaea]|nr:hypothetical protein [Loxospora ochrophaea]